MSSSADKPVVSKRVDRKENKPATLEAKIEEMEKQLEVKVNESANWEKECKEVREKEARTRSEMRELGEGGRGWRKRVGPIVVVVLLKAVHKKVIKATPPPERPQDKRVQTIRNLQERFAEFGCANAEQVDTLAEIWEDIISKRNTAAHEISGDDVIMILPDFKSKESFALERTFFLFWDIAPFEWSKASPEPSALVFRNCSDSELDDLG